VIGTRAIPKDAAVFHHPNPVVFEGTHDLHEVVADLHQRGFRRIYVEGGPTLASAFVAAGLVDEYAIYLAPSLLGGPRLALGDVGVETIGEQRRLRILDVERLGGDLLIRAVPVSPGAPRVSRESAEDDIAAGEPVDVRGADIFPTPTTQEG
jgi:diaminohydroxyphosphoribosylaminopyrimidine deaminase/5-amino-6-(5-phosphoribosylamino)uracil reductase